MAWRLDHVQLAIPSGEERRDGFYVSRLGFERLEKSTVLAARARGYRCDGLVVQFGRKTTLGSPSQRSKGDRSASGDDVTETDRRLHGGAGAPGWGRRRTRGKSAESSSRCIGRRRYGPRRPRMSEFGWSFGHCELAGCADRVRLVSRSFRSCQRIRHADRQRRCRTCHVGPRLRLPYASSSRLLSSSVSNVCRPRPRFAAIVTG